VFPAIYLGVALTWLIGIATDMSTTAALAIGASAGMAAMTRMLLTSIMLATLLVGTAGINAVPVAVLAAATAWLAIAALDPVPPPPPPVDAVSHEAAAPRAAHD
jgi:hypothetical protein